MSYRDGIAKKTGRIGEKEADIFLANHGFDAKRPPGPDVGIDRVVRLPERPQKHAKIQVKGRGQVANPRWFQLTVPATQIRDAFERGEDLEQLWKQRIYQVEFWLLVSIPKNEIWVFPSDVILEIAMVNECQYKTRQDNQYKAPHYDRNGKIQKKQKELNLDITDDSGTLLWQRFQSYRDNAEAINSFLNSF